MHDIDSVLEDVIDELKDDSVMFPAETRENLNIPTLKPGVSRDLSPQLKARFSRLGAWHDSTHGDWLALSEIEKLVSGNLDSARMKGIKTNLDAAAQHWANDTASLVVPERISYFAASEFTSERVYLIWFDNYEEPEICVYDVNGESRYLDLKSYLSAYVEDDEDEVNQTWKLSSDEF